MSGRAGLTIQYSTTCQGFILLHRGRHSIQNRFQNKSKSSV